MAEGVTPCFCGYSAAYGMQAYYEEVQVLLRSRRGLHPPETPVTLGGVTTMALRFHR